MGTDLAQNKEVREFAGRSYLLEHAIRADFALIKAQAGDRWGNLIYRKAARNFGPVMAMAADVTIAQVAEIREVGEVDPEAVVTPSVFVQRIVCVPDPISERDYLRQLERESA